MEQRRKLTNHRQVHVAQQLELEEYVRYLYLQHKDRWRAALEERFDLTFHLTDRQMVLLLTNLFRAHLEAILQASYDGVEIVWYSKQYSKWRLFVSQYDLPRVASWMLHTGKMGYPLRCGVFIDIKFLTKTQQKLEYEQRVRKELERKRWLDEAARNALARPSEKDGGRDDT